MQISAEKTATLGRDVAETLWNLPNGITLVRIGLPPLLIALPWFHGRTWSGIIGFAFLAVSLTDILDGYLARLHGLESRIGKLLDPLADKVLVMTALVMLVAVGRIPPWALPLVIAILAREFALSGLRGVAGDQGLVISTPPPGKWEKGGKMSANTELLVHRPVIRLPGQRL